MSNPHKGRTGCDRVLNDTARLIAGLEIANRKNGAFRRDFRLAAVMLPSTIQRGFGCIKVARLACAAVFVLIVERLNSTVEAAFDKVFIQFDDAFKRANDCAGGAALMSLLPRSGIWPAAFAHRLLT